MGVFVERKTKNFTERVKLRDGEYFLEGENRLLQREKVKLRVGEYF